MKSVATESSFFYASEGLVVPHDVTIVRVGFTRIRDFAFNWCRNLIEVELCQGLELIGVGAFRHAVALISVGIPPSVRTIAGSAFNSCVSLVNVELSEGLQLIERHAFNGCTSITRIKLPSTVKEIGMRSFYCCESLTSVELSQQGLKRIESQAFERCKSLKNIVLPCTLEDIEDGGMFKGCDLIEKRFKNEDALFIGIATRLDDLPVHKLCYYHLHSEHRGDNSEIKHIINSNNSSCRSIDMFGMTPLHILMLSSKPDLEILKSILPGHEANLVAVDDWKFLPIDYACGTDAPIEMVRLLLETQNKLFPDLIPDWRKLVSAANTRASPKVIKYLVRQSISDRLDQLGLARWQLDVSSLIDDLVGDMPAEARPAQIGSAYSRLQRYEQKEATALLEMALWTAKLHLSFLDPTQLNPAERSMCRINCGDEIVIANVLPFLGYGVQAV